MTDRDKQDLKNLTDLYEQLDRKGMEIMQVTASALVARQNIETADDKEKTEES